MSASVLVALVCATVTLALAGMWARAHLSRREEYRHHRDRFFSLARDLIQAEDCPIELALALRILGGSMNRFAVLAILVCSAVTRGRLPRLEPPAGFSAALKDSPKPVLAGFGDAYKAAVRAVSYRSVLFGALIRRHYCGNHGPGNVDQAVIGEVVRYGTRHEIPEFLESTAGGGLRLKVAGSGATG
jgi:hypothetical protein